MDPHYAVSVVIPVFNGAATINSTLLSLQQQHYPHWEAVVVDDGSSDDTAAVVEAFDDSRVRLIRQENRGVSAARNTGTHAARFPWVLYLDGDDLISPRYLEQVIGALQHRRSARLAVTTWTRLAPDGRLYQEVNARYFDDLFDTAAQHCPFSIHACVVSRELVIAVGGWDESLIACEDWDLWARLARTGAGYVVVEDALAVYRTRPTSASFDGMQLLRGGISVLERTHGPDPRVRNPAPNYRLGRDPADLQERVLGHATWCAGQVIGVGRDPVALLEAVAQYRAPLLDPQTVATVLDVAGGVGSMGRQLHERWIDHHKLFVRFLEGLEAISGTPRLAARAELELARRAADNAPTRGALDLGRVWAMTLDVHQPLPRIEIPAEITRVRVNATAGAMRIGVAELLAVDGVVEPDRLHDALVGQLAGEIFDHYSGTLAESCAATGPVRSRGRSAQLAATIWGEPTDQRARRVPPPSVGGRWQVELSAPVGDLVAAPGSSVDVAASLGGLHIGTFRISTRTGRVPMSRVRATVLRHGRSELTRAVVSIGLLGRQPVDDATLRERLRAASSRTTPPLQPVRHVRVPLARSWWPNLADVKPAAVRRARNAAHQLSPMQQRLAKRAYVHLRRLPEALQGGRIPVLMYHRVSPIGNPATDRWRVAPDQLEQQLSAVRRAGFSLISVEHLRQIMFEGARAPRRPVVLSFDDGYADFAEHAWPVLRSHGAGATVYVVAGEAGRTNRWDDVFDHPAPLMDWSTLRQLAAEGLDLGSHSFDHPMLTSLSTDEVPAQVTASKQTIEQNTGVSVQSFAYPYGDADAVVADIVGSAGYMLAVTCDQGSVTARSQPLLLPRVEVTGSMTARDLLVALGRRRG